MKAFAPKPLAAAMIVAAAFAAPSMSAQAQTSAKPAETAAATQARSNPEASALMKMSQEGNQAMREIRLARIAIFDGDPKMARELVGKARTDLEAATKAAPQFIVNTRTGVDGKIVQDSTDVARLNMVPIDGQISLADTFVPTPEKVKHIDKANEHLKAGRAKQGIEELRLAEVDVNYTRALLPLDQTTRRVDEANSLLAKDKYYEANLALKAAEDGVVLDSVSLVETPAKAGKPAEKPAPAKK